MEHLTGEGLFIIIVLIWLSGFWFGYEAHKKETK